MPTWMTGWFTAQTVTAFLFGAVVSAIALYYQHWFQRAAKRQSIAQHLHHYLGKIVEAMQEVEQQVKLQPKYYQCWHLSQCVEWLKELVDAEGGLSELENPELAMELTDKIRGAYRTAAYFQDTFRPVVEPFDPTGPFAALSSSLGPMPFLNSLGNLNTLRRKLAQYRGPLLLQWLPRRTEFRGRGLLAKK